MSGQRSRLPPGGLIVRSRRSKVSISLCGEGVGGRNIKDGQCISCCLGSGFQRMGVDSPGAFTKGFKLPPLGTNPTDECYRSKYISHIARISPHVEQRK